MGGRGGWRPPRGGIGESPREAPMGGGWGGGIGCPCDPRGHVLGMPGCLGPRLGGGGNPWDRPDWRGGRTGGAAAPMGGGMIGCPWGVHLGLPVGDTWVHILGGCPDAWVHIRAWCSDTWVHGLPANTCWQDVGTQASRRVIPPLHANPLPTYTGGTQASGRGFPPPPPRHPSPVLGQRPWET